VLLGVAAMQRSGAFGSDTQAFLRRFILLPIGVVGGIIFFALGFWEQAARYNFYAVLIVAAVFCGPMLGISHQVYFGLTGIIIILSGLIMLAGFLRKYPLPDKEVVKNERY
jgi:hypothetical protein